MMMIIIIIIWCDFESRSTIAWRITYIGSSMQKQFRHLFLVYPAYKHNASFSIVIPIANVSALIQLQLYYLLMAFTRRTY